MKAVWSFWSKPYRSQLGSPWLTERHHWLSWVLSVETARKHYQHTTLITDDEGAHILVDHIGLQFSSVSQDLQILEDENPCWWALGKLHAYHAQQGPFMHIDSDVYLWQRLPSFVEQAPAFAQSPESAEFCYQSERATQIVRDSGGWIPEPWQWYITSGMEQLASCCGILGGTNAEMLREYAEFAIRMITEPVNRSAWARLNDECNFMIDVEQYLLNACVEYRRRYGDASVYLQYLFNSINGPYQAENAAALGYTHLLSVAKRDHDTVKRLEEVVRRDYPVLYQNCVAYAESVEQPLRV